MKLRMNYIMFWKCNYSFLYFNKGIKIKIK